MGQVTKIPQKLHSTRIARKFPRVLRENNNLSNEHITAEMANFYPIIDNYSVCVAKECPFDGFEIVYEVDLQDVVPFFNSLLIYRILKQLYNDPDILCAVIENIGAADSRPVGMAALDWGYIIQIADDLFAEIRSIYNNSRFKLRYWMIKIPTIEMEKERCGKEMAEFLKEFIDCVEKNVHLFDENQEIKDGAKSRSAVANVFAEKYTSAMRIYGLSQNIDRLPKKKVLAWEEKVEINTGGSLFMSSAILFIISLESLINTIYHLMLKSEFRHESYERATIRADLDIRLISAHIFCEGFSKPILTPNTDLWNRVLKLRKFRNDVIHGNICQDHQFYTIQEDNIIFYYSGIIDYRGRKTEEKARKQYPTSMSQINKSVVSEIKETVDSVIAALTDAANEEGRVWINSWLWEAIIPKFKENRS